MEDSGIGNWGIWILAITFVVLPAIRYGFALYSILKLRFQQTSFGRIPEEAISSSSRALIDLAAHRLAPLGFEYLVSCKDTSLIAEEADDEKHVFVNWQKQVYAHVSVKPKAIASSFRAFDLSFLSYFEDATMLQTLDQMKHLLLPSPDPIQIEDAYSGNIETQWAAHLKVLNFGKRESTPVLADQNTYSQLAAAFENHYLQHWEEIGFVKRSGDRWQPLLKGGWNTAKQVLAATKAATAEQSKQAGKPKVSFPLPTSNAPAANPSTEAADFLASLKSHQVSNTSRGKKRSLYLISGAAFLVIGGLLWGWEFGLWLLIVIAIHEWGHALAMRLFGYRDVKMLFVPGLGAAAIGQKEDSTPKEEYWVYLMGPLPGLILGAGMLYSVSFHGLDALSTLGIVFLILNYFNLLPFLPLDGGRIVHLLFMRRSSTLDIGFYLFSCVFILLIGHYLDEPVMKFIGIALAVGVPMKWRKTKLHRAVQRELAGKDPTEEEVARVLLHELKQSGISKQLENVQYDSAKEVFKNVRSPKPSKRLMIAGGLLYTFLFWGPVLGFLVFINQAVGFGGIKDLVELSAEFEQDEARFEALELQANQTTNLMERWEATYTLLGADTYFLDETNTVEYADSAIALAEQLFEKDDLQRMRTYVRVADATWDSNRFAVAATVLKQNGYENHPLMAEVEFNRFMMAATETTSTEQQVQELRLLEGIRRKLEAGSDDPASSPIYRSLLDSIVLQHETLDDPRAVIAVQSQIVFNVHFSDDQQHHLVTASRLIINQLDSEDYRGARHSYERLELDHMDWDQHYSDILLARLLTTASYAYSMGETPDWEAADACLHSALTAVESLPRAMRGQIHLEILTDLSWNLTAQDAFAENEKIVAKLKKLIKKQKDGLLMSEEPVVARGFYGEQERRRHQVLAPLL